MIGTEVILQRLSGLYTSGSDVVAKVRGWWLPVWGFLTFNLMDGFIMPRKSLAVSVERGALWVVLGSKFLSKLKITGFRKYTADEGKYMRPEVLASTLSLACKELKAGRTDITLGIPRDWVIIRTVELPSVVRPNITNVIAYELDRLTPLSAEEAYYDFRILWERDEKLTILLVVARADLLDQYLGALKEENVAVDRVSVNLAGLGALAGFLEPSADPICLEVDSFGYEGAVIGNGEIVSAFGGSFTEQNPAHRADEVAAGVEPAIQAAMGLGLAPRVFVYAKDGDDAGLGNLLTVPVVTLGRKDFGQKLSAMDEDMSHAAVGSVIESLLGGAKGLNILGKGQRRKVAIPRALTYALVLLFLAAWVPYVVLPLEREKSRLQEINRQISIRKDEMKKVEALVKEVDALSKEAASIDEFKETKPMSLALLKELTENLPKTVWLTRARVTDTAADIEGYANSASEILPKLEQSKYFRKVEFASPTVRDTRLNQDRFVIKMEIEGFGKEDGEKGKEGTEKAKQGPADKGKEEPGKVKEKGKEGGEKAKDGTKK